MFASHNFFSFHSMVSQTSFCNNRVYWYGSQKLLQYDVVFENKLVFYVVTNFNNQHVGGRNLKFINIDMTFDLFHSFLENKYL